MTTDRPLLDNLAKRPTWRLFNTLTIIRLLLTHCCTGTLPICEISARAREVNHENNEL